MIDFKGDNLAVTMSEALELESIEVDPESYVVGQSTFYLFKIRTIFELKNGDILFMEFPEELSSPLFETFAYCQGVRYLQKALSCSVSGKYGLYLTLS
mmetsp:Transcript_8756/g.8058  ORF Transcript_8756/g.8058 Transcript_8756/m.8058 type:complete len:98 (+) Transcript_8756:1857-2150(+)